MHPPFRYFVLGYILCFCLLISLFTGATAEFQGYFCPNTSTYTPNSTYGANLKSLLSTLSSNANRENGFYNFTAGGVYGLFMCRGDVSTADCGACVSDASATVLQKCPNETSATIWYDYCMLRYSNEPVYGRPDPSFVPLYLYIGNNDSQPDSFMRSVNKTLTQVAIRVIDKKFATQEDNFTVLESIYSLGQCRPDLPNSDYCKTCLGKAIQVLQTCCYSRLSATAISPDCNIKYSTDPFYNIAPPPTSATSEGNKGNSSSKVIIAIVVLVTGIILFIAIFCFVRIKKEKKSKTTAQTKVDVSGISIEEISQYDFATIQAITNDFSLESKIGEGGYGSVYKGKLPSGQEVAVKRLSRGSGQGAQEFKNEVGAVAKLQHRNLVRLLGFYSRGEEKILIYEFVLNKSLDHFLFDPAKKQLLNWSTRYKIIGGIARGLLYLHEDSRLKIIHRDLKASNVLLDRDMNPKISDFGLARIFMVDQTQENTSRIIGTYGYMSPEYILHGLFSVKSDVFSYGVLLLEIITGKKNSSFPSSMESTGAQDLLSYAWNHWREDRPLDMVDQSLGGLYSRNEVIQCIHVGLLCVQEKVDDRPTMANVVLMLNSYSATRKTPNPPAFFNGVSEMISAGQEAD